MDRKTLLATRREVAAMLALAGIAASGRPSLAQTPSWPSGLGRIIVGFSAGGSTDSFARQIASEYQDRFHQSFVDENRPGAGGWPATLFVSQAKPDGLTLTFNANGIAIYGVVQKNSFDATKDLTPIALAATSPVALLIPAILPVKTVPEFVAYCKAHPGEVFYSSAGVGSINHLYAELFNQRAGTGMKHVPYRGNTEGLPDLISNRVQISFSSYATGSGLIKNGQLRLLAYGGDTRPEGTLPAPSVREFGIDYNVSFWWGLFGPKGMALDLQTKINAATNQALQDPAMAKLFLASGVVASPMEPKQFAAIVEKDYRILKELAESAHMVF